MRAWDGPAGVIEDQGVRSGPLQQVSVEPVERDGQAAYPVLPYGFSAVGIYDFVRTHQGPGEGLIQGLGPFR